MANAGYAITRPGIAKIITIILGIISVGLTSYAYDKVWKEEVYLGVIITCLVISVLLYAIHLLVNDVEQNTSSKAADSGFHFIAALIILVAGSLMIYSAVDLYNHWKYFCSYGFDRGIPCVYDKYGDNNYYGNYGKSYNPNNNNGYSNSNYYNGNTNINGYPSQSYGTGIGNSYQNTEYGAPGAAVGRTFIKPSWFNWLKGANVYEECREILPRVLRCNEYFELKLASGIIGILNGIFYGVTGIIILVSN